MPLDVRDTIKTRVGTCIYVHVMPGQCVVCQQSERTVAALLVDMPQMQ